MKVHHGGTLPREVLPSRSYEVNVDMGSVLMVTVQCTYHRSCQVRTQNMCDSVCIRASVCVYIVCVVCVYVCNYIYRYTSKQGTQLQRQI